MWPWHSEREKFISEDRKVALISDIDSLVPAELKNLFSLIDEMIETNKETVSSVFERIKGSSKPACFILSLVEHAFKIRPLNTKPILSLFCMVLKMPRYNKLHADNYSLYRLLSKQGIICKQEESGDVSV